MRTWIIICYRQYGQWTSTVPFESLRRATEHVKLYLDRPEKDYIKNVTYLEVELPE